MCFALHLGVSILQNAVRLDKDLYAGTWLVLDGEAIPYKRTYAEVHRSLCKVIVA